MKNENPNTPKYRLSPLLKEFLYFALTGLSFVVAREILKALFPKLKESIISMAGYSLLLLLIALFVFFRATKLTKGILKIFYTTIFTLLLLGIVYYWISIFTARQTDYFIVDASDGMENLFTEVQAKLKFNEKDISSNKDVGLAIFGGRVRGKSGCDDIEELVSPKSKGESLPEIYGALDLLKDIQPIGKGNIQRALLFALDKLKARPGVQRIILITSGIGDQCFPMEKEYLNNYALQNKIKYELVVLTVGKISEDDEKMLREFATNQNYVNAKSPDQVSQNIEIILNAPTNSSDLYYFGYYGYIP